MAELSYFGWAISLRSKQHRKLAVFVYKGDLSVYRCVDGLHHLDLIAHLVLVWRSDLPDSPLPFNCQPGSGQQMVDCFVKYLRKPPSLPPWLLLKEFASLMVVLVHQAWRQLARQMEGEKALLPLMHIFSLKREQMYCEWLLWRPRIFRRLWPICLQAARRPRKRVAGIFL